MTNVDEIQAETCPLRGKRIALVRYDVFTRGSDMMAHILADELRGAGATVHIYHPRGRFATTLPIDSTHYRPLRSRGAPILLAEIALKDWTDYDYLMADFAPLVVALGIRHRARLAYYAQNHDPVYYRNRLCRGAMHQLCRTAIQRWRLPVFCTSHQLARVLHGEYGVNPVVIRQGDWRRLLSFRQVQEPTSQFARQRRQVVLGIAGATYAKGPDLLRRTFEELDRESGDDLEFWCVGHALEGRFARAKFRHFGVVDHVKLRQLFTSANVFLFTSRVENFPSPPFEAMVSGCPVVSTPVAEYLDGDRNCILVDDLHPGRLAAAVQCVLNDHGLAHRLIAGGHHTVRDAEEIVATTPSPAVDVLTCLTQLEGFR